MLETQQIVQVPVVEQMFLNRKVIAEILDMAWISDDEVYFPLCSNLIINSCVCKINHF